MAREPETYRALIDDIRARCGDKGILSVTDVSRYCGKTREWVRNNLGITGDGIPTVTLAMKLATWK